MADNMPKGELVTAPSAAELEESFKTVVVNFLNDE